MDQRAIGVFDSGVGGLTVVREIQRMLPHESVIYIGDTARVPYGTRSQETIQRFAVAVTKKLLEQKVKLIVIACNTVSAVAFGEVQKAATVPVIGVIGPTVEKAVKLTRTGQVAVIGTRATIKSGIYARKIKALSRGLKVIEKATPLLVPMAEEGMFNHPAAIMMIKEYLKVIKANQEIDTLILGCTHYPLFRKAIEDILGKKIKVIDSAKPTAETVKAFLREKKILADGAKPTQVFFTSDEPGKSHNIAKTFLGEDLELKQIII